jgi:hypothetical protein
LEIFSFGFFLIILSKQNSSAPFKNTAKVANAKLKSLAAIGPYPNIVVIWNKCNANNNDTVLVNNPNNNKDEDEFCLIKDDKNSENLEKNNNKDKLSKEEIDRENELNEKNNNGNTYPHITIRV